ncbi:MAG: hypothetical protein SNJ57_07895 [Cyanobacteriota bacterium]
MCDDTQVQTLLDEIRSPDTTPLLRRKALSRLLLCIQRSPKLRRFAHPDYGHALSLTLEWVCRAIAQFSPRSDSISTDLMNWVNGYLDWRIRDLQNPNKSVTELHRPEREERQIKQEFGGVVLLDQSIGEDGNPTPVGDLTPDPRQDMTLLESWIQALQRAQKRRIGLEIHRYLAADPDAILQGCHPNKFLECHCQALIQRMHLSEPPETRRAIAQDFGMPEQTLYSHWRDKCLPLLQIVALRFDPQVIDFLQSEEARYLGECHPEALKSGNCLDLAKRLLLSQPPESMGAIARDLKIKESALTKHWQSECLPKLKKHRL